jgi:demethylmenaquinone methyltransferase/2-methoxy-6-polyprenyl-1,4-benzoquinol methylase
MPFDHFGWLAPHYEKLFKPHFEEAWLRLLSLPARGRLLDIGGGTGRLSQFFSDSVDQVIVLDESGKMLRQAREKDRLLLLRGHAQRLPLGNCSVERIVMIDALHHLEDQSWAVKEMARILRPGGRFLIEEPDIANIWVKAIAWIERVLGMRSRFLRGNEILGLFTGLPVKIQLEPKDGILWISGEKLGEEPVYCA